MNMRVFITMLTVILAVQAEELLAAPLYDMRPMLFGSQWSAENLSPATAWASPLTDNSIEATKASNPNVTKIQTPTPSSAASRRRNFDAEGGKFYISGNVGVSTLVDSDTKVCCPLSDGLFGEGSFDDGSIFTGAVGYLKGSLRVEGELSHRKNDWEAFTSGGTRLVTEGDFSSLSFMVNGWYDFNTNTNWVPFVGGGVGISRMSMKINRVGNIATSFDKIDTVLASQFGAGIGYKLTPKVTINLSYRLFGTQKVELEDIYEYLNHSIMLGSRITF